jgi:hypothetical protein
VSDPHIRAKYNKKVMKILWKDGTIDKVKQLREIVREQGSTEEAKQLHKEIWASRKQAGLDVSKDIRKIHTGAYPFSPAVKRLIAQKILWSRVIRYHKNPKMDS